MRVAVAAVLAAALVFLAGCKPADPPAAAQQPSAPVTKSAPTGSKLVDQRDRWARAEICKIDILRTDKAVALFQRTRPRYEAVSRRCPSTVIFCLHGRESTWDFTCHLHEGSPLTHRTRDVPENRPPPPAQPPFTWEQSAIDALYVLKHEDRVAWSDTVSALDAIEAYNGLGYRKYHPDVPSPYLWAATSIYSRGKYVADGRFDRMAVDKQLGCAAILKRMAERGIDIPFR